MLEFIIQAKIDFRSGRVACARRLLTNPLLVNIINLQILLARNQPASAGFDELKFRLDFSGINFVARENPFFIKNGGGSFAACVGRDSQIAESYFHRIVFVKSRLFVASDGGFAFLTAIKTYRIGIKTHYGIDVAVFGCRFPTVYRVRNFRFDFHGIKSGVGVGVAVGVGVFAFAEGFGEVERVAFGELVFLF